MDLNKRGKVPKDFSHFFSAIQNQIVKLLPAIALSLLIALGGVGSSVFLARVTNNPLWKLTKDPAQVLHFPLYIGWLSNLSGLLWMMAATVCLFGAEILRRQGGMPKSVRFLGISGLLNLYLGFDDLFLLHDRVFPQFLNLPEKFFYFAYVLLILIYLVYFFSQILKYDYLLLFIAAALIGLSRRIFVTLPVLEEVNTAGDIMKFFGIAFWLVFFYRTSFQEVARAFARDRE